MDVSGLRRYFHVAPFQFPFCRSAVFVQPLRKILAVEENHGIGWSLARRLLGAGRSGGDDRWKRPVEIMNFPLGINLSANTTSAQQKKKSSVQNGKGFSHELHLCEPGRF